MAPGTATSRQERTTEQRPKRERGPDRDRRGARSEGRGEERRDRDQGSPVVGMGDHVPDFLLRGFKPEKV